MAFDPHKINKDHVLQAIARIKADGKELIPSTKWDVIIENERYPPKEVLRYAHHEMNGEFLWDHSGGENTNNYLKKLGFEVVEKRSLSDPIKELIQKYKVAIQENELANEEFKWKLVKQFKGKPNLEAPDFYEEIKGIDYSKFMYMNGARVIKHLAKDRPEQYRTCFRLLFNEDLPLADRLKRFPAEVLRIYRELQPDTTQSTHHDERTIATLLTYHNPDKYTFYMDSFYQKYCALVGIQPKKAGEKYIHYLGLLDDFIAEYLAPDKELLDKVRELLLEDAYPDRNHKLLAQDIFYSMLEGANTDASFRKDEKALQAIIKKSSPENLNFYFHLLDRLIDDLLIPDEHNTVFSTSDKLSFQVGIRYCLNLRKNDFYFIAPEDYVVEGLEKGNFDGPGQPAWFRKASASIATQHYPAIREAIQVELERNKNTQPKKYDNAAFRKAAFDKDYRATLFEFQETEAMAGLNSTHANGKSGILLNQILYGPPGTGKTYNTINKALEILGEQVEGIDRATLKKTFEKKVSEGQVVFTTFHQSMSYEDFIEGIKPETVNEKVIYEVKPGIFKQICTTAQTPNQVDFNKAYANLKNDLIEINGQLLDLKTPTGKSFSVTLNSNDNLSLYTGPKKEKQGVLTKENIQKQIKGEYKYLGWEGYFMGVINHLKEKYNYNSKASAIPQNFVLIIDEINRGNVSQIFGELITLIEEDKRLGKKEQLTVTLPYSKEIFCVPANLYIIGTMNTADRSVEALDTALRRRFSFVEMPPRYDLQELETTVGGYTLKDILQKINRRIEKLLGKDNLIGHSYFLSVDDAKDLREAFLNKIIPLLQEYFYGDFGKIGLVLGEGFFKDEEQDDQDIFAAFGSYDSSGLAEKEVYHLAELVGENQLTDSEFKEALDILMK